ncbi:SDR family oxidoreductase [Noviherbaspirillum aerium]|uniref:SDR family oxidoreductase n=1 Tax=Noviherbaspirillum aerium TaxID=2588497 RepID=UPI00124CBEBA|nr:SDR family oxidoreductase [Noviherbaspirillum aerium]
MDLELAGKHVLIAGGSKGIGLACARMFLLEGARVSIVSRSLENLRAGADLLQNELGSVQERIAIKTADLREPSSALTVLDELEALHGPVDILVNSAGAARRTLPDDLEPADWHDAMQSKYFTYIHMMNPLIKRMGSRGAGCIVNIIGAGGKVASTTHLPGGAANAALMLVSAGLAAAYGPKGVRVNAVNPGMTLTERLKSGLAAEARLNQVSEDDALANATMRLPLRRIADPEEIANAVAFLASSKASYINGTILAMDGGLTPLI